MLTFITKRLDEITVNTTIHKIIEIVDDVGLLFRITHMFVVEKMDSPMNNAPTYFSKPIDIAIYHAYFD